jgi:hypothetical protein
MCIYTVYIHICTVEKIWEYKKYLEGNGRDLFQCAILDSSGENEKSRMHVPYSR